MPKFLTSVHISACLENLITQSKSFVYIVSPYIDINPLLKVKMDDKAQKRPFYIIYGKKRNNNLEENYTKKDYYSIYYNENLHGKIYLSEKAVLLTSLNLYEYSQVNNIEFGIYIEKRKNRKLYESIYNEIVSLKNNSEVIWESESPFIMRNLFNELSEYKYGDDIVNKNESDGLYKAICRYAMENHKFNSSELYQDGSAIYRHTEISEDFYNKIKKYFIRKSIKKSLFSNLDKIISFDDKK